MNMMYRAALCNDCIENGTCFHCGCSTYELIMSGKPCKRIDENEYLSEDNPGSTGTRQEELSINS